jgi:hypothetical protein
VLDRKSGDRIAGGGVSGVSLVADGGGVSGVGIAMVVIWGWSVASMSFRRLCRRLILRIVLGVSGRVGGWKASGDGKGSGDIPASEWGWWLGRRGVASGVRRRPRYCSARFSAERTSASMSTSWVVLPWFGRCSVGEVGDVGLDVAYWLPWVKVDRRGGSSGSNSASKTTFGTEGGELALLSSSGEEAESQSLGSRAKEGEGGGG